MAKGSDREVSQAPRKFGVFYPRGYVIVSFETEAAAERVRRSLIDGGYDEDDVHLMDTKMVLEGSSADLADLSPLIRALGSETQIMEGHRAEAAAGHTFLLAYAPSDLDADRLMNVARREGYLKAQKYDRFSLREM